MKRWNIGKYMSLDKIKQTLITYNHLKHNFSKLLILNKNELWRNKGIIKIYEKQKL